MEQPGTRDQESGKQQVSLTSRLTWRRRPPARMCWKFEEDEATYPGFVCEENAEWDPTSTLSAVRTYRIPMSSGRCGTTWSVE
eukprot:6946518-Pyramimonas_sp.AAC.1